MRLDVHARADKQFRKLPEREFEKIQKKIKQILKNPKRYKPLRGDMHGAYRVHIRKSYVLVYEVKGDIVRILDYAHHDEIYR